MSFTREETDILIPLRQKFKAGSVLFREGERSDETYILLNGQIEIQKGGQKIVVISQEGSFFGEMATLLNEPRTATAISLNDSMCIVMSGKNLEKTITTTPEIAMKLMRTVATRLSITTQELVSVMDKADKLQDQFDVLSNRTDQNLKNDYIVNNSDFSSFDKEESVGSASSNERRSKHIMEETISISEIHRRFPYQEKVNILMELVKDQVFVTHGKEFNALQRELARFNKEITFIEPERSSDYATSIALIELARRYDVKDQFDIKVVEGYKLTFTNIVREIEVS